MENQRSFFSQGEMPSAVILKEGAGEEDTFLWTLADLLTLLLIFFIFLYAQSLDQLPSRPPASHSMNAATAVPSARSASALPEREGSTAIKTFSIRPVIIPQLNDAKPDIHPIQEADMPPANAPAQEVAELRREPENTTAPDVSPPGQDSMQCLRQEALSAIHETEKSACSIRWNQNRLVFVLGERLTFPLGEARLLEDFRPTLDRIARLIAEKKEYRVMVSGHTDDTPIATAEFPSNWELSAARAITVAKSIIQSGVDPHRITTQGYGEFRPLHENSSPQNREANRRVEIALIMEKDRDQDSEAAY